MSEKMREAFEAYKSRVAAQMIGGGEGRRVRQILERLSFSDFEAGWNASRAALVVELPPLVDAKPYACYESGRNDMRGEVREAIEAAGVKVAP